MVARSGRERIAVYRLHTRAGRLWAACRRRSCIVLHVAQVRSRPPSRRVTTRRNPDAHTFQPQAAQRRSESGDRRCHARHRGRSRHVRRRARRSRPERRRARSRSSSGRDLTLSTSALRRRSAATRPAARPRSRTSPAPAGTCPGLASAVAVDGPWWYGRAPVFGGDPASGETEDSYFARTGRHLPASAPSVAPVRSGAAEQWLTPEIPAGLECRPDAAQRWRVPNIPVADLPSSADAADHWLTPEIVVADLPRTADAAERWLCFAS